MWNAFFQKNKWSLLLLPLFLLVACAIPVKPGDMGQKDLDYYFQTSGAVEFFLPQLPQWANASASAACHRTTSVRYLDFSALKGSYNLSYAQMVNFQHTFNLEQDEQIRTFGAHAQGPGEEEKLFYKVSDQVRAGHYIFNAPNYPQINVVWIDHILVKGPTQGRALLERLYQHPAIASGHPVWLSLCYNHAEMAQWMSNAKLEAMNAKWLTTEFFSAYDKDGVLAYNLQLNVSEFLGADKKISFFAPDKSKLPAEVVGTFSLKTIP